MNDNRIPQCYRRCRRAHAGQPATEARDQGPAQHNNSLGYLLGQLAFSDGASEDAILAAFRASFGVQVE